MSFVSVDDPEIEYDLRFMNADAMLYRVTPAHRMKPELAALSGRERGSLWYRPRGRGQGRGRGLNRGEANLKRRRLTASEQDENGTRYLIVESDQNLMTKSWSPACQLIGKASGDDCPSSSTHRRRNSSTC